MNFLIPDKEPTDVADNNVGKMTDNEIVKAWIVVIENKRMPTEYLINVTVDRINSLTAEVLRQQAEINVKKRLLDKAEAEIERLKQIVGFTPARGSGKSPFLNSVLDNVRSEAYREFAERFEKELFIKQNEHREHWMETLNRHRCTEAYKDHEWSIDNWLRGYGEAVQDILAINQNFLKELVGDDDG